MAAEWIATHWKIDELKYFWRLYNMLNCVEATPRIFEIEINKNLKFEKGLGIVIKSKETSSKLAI